MKKPTPPTQNAIEADLAAALRRLGAEKYETQNDDTRVFNELVRHWKEHKQPPLVSDLAANLGMPRTSVHFVLRDLCSEGRVIHVRRGVYVPKV